MNRAVFPPFRAPSSALRTWLVVGTILLSIPHAAAAKETLVHNVAEFDAGVKEAEPGDTIVLADGEWSDADLVFRGRGESDENPITLRAETPGKVVLIGTSRLRIGGKHLLVRDLFWKDTTVPSEVISFRVDSKNPAEHCTLRECAIVGDLPDKERKWVSLYGAANVVQLCRFEGKQSGGTLLVVWLDEGQGPNEHFIIGNFFGPRERLGKNGGEIIRIGDSKTSLQTSGAKVLKNYFYRCDGEAEIISNKSCENVYSMNTFVGCSGALTLRHGNQCRVSMNHFIGDGRKGTGGVRVIGAGHEVGENVFYELTGDETRAALSLMNGIPDSPLNGYFQVKNALIEANAFIDCQETIVLGLRDKDQKQQSLPPVDCTFKTNLVATVNRPVFIVHNASEGIKNDDNLYVGGELGIVATPGWFRSKDRSRFDFETFPLHTKPSGVGPAWMRPGDEYLPKVLQTQ